MFDHDEYYRQHGEDPLSVSRGILFGIILGSVMWAAMIAVIYFIVL